VDNIQEVIWTLGDSQRKEFVFFIQRNKYRKGRKDLQLFNILKSERQYSPKEITQQLKTPNSNAYHTIRKRLFAHLADFIVIQSTTRDASSYSHVNALLSVVIYLFDKSLNNQAWKYLLIAEETSIKHDFTDLLNTLYLLQIEKCHLQDGTEISKIIKKYDQNKEQLVQSERVQIASSLIQNKLLVESKKGITVDFQKLVNSSLEDLSINDAVLHNPRVALAITKIIRSGTVALKNFHQFEYFVTTTFEKSYRNRRQYNPVIKAEFLYLIAHAYYRNRKFGNSLSKIKELTTELLNCSMSTTQNYYAKVNQLKASNLMFLNKIDDSIVTLKQLLTNTSKLSLVEKTNTITVLGIYSFLNNDLSEAKKQVALLNKSDEWYRKNMGLEWLFKKLLMEIVLYIDLSEQDRAYLDLVDSKVKSFERTFKILKSNPIFNRAFSYLNLIKKSQGIYNKKELTKEIKKNIEFLAHEEEDIQAMSFYAWIKSKSIGQNFYKTLLEVANKKG
jgi:hypothetical protein